MSRKFFKTVKQRDRPSASEHNKITRTLSDLTADSNRHPKHYSRLRLIRLTDVIGHYGNEALPRKDRDRPAIKLHYEHPTEEFFDNAQTLDNVCDPFGLVYDDNEYVLAFYSEQSCKFYPVNPRTVRHAVTCRDSSNRYPDRPANTYPIKFTKIVYPEAGGQQTPVVSYLFDSPANDDFVFNIFDETIEDVFIPEGTHIWVYNVTNQWFTAFCCQVEESSQSHSDSSFSSSSKSSSSSSSESSSNSSSKSSSSVSDSSNSSSKSSSSLSSASSVSQSSGSSASGESSVSSSESFSESLSSLSISGSSSGYDCITVVSGETPPVFDTETCTLTWCTRQICFPVGLGITIGDEVC